MNSLQILPTYLYTPLQFALLNIIVMTRRSKFASCAHRHFVRLLVSGANRGKQGPDGVACRLVLACIRTEIRHQLYYYCFVVNCFL